MRNCTICGCPDTLFDPKTGRCIRQGCVCPGCVFEAAPAKAAKSPSGGMGGDPTKADLGSGVGTIPASDKPTGKAPAKVQ